MLLTKSQRIIITAAALTGIFCTSSASANSSESTLIRNSYSNLCLGVAGASKEWGAKIVQWECEWDNPNSNHIWKITDDGFIQNKYSGLCLGVAGASKEWGAHIVQWGCDWGAQDTNHKWEVMDQHVAELEIDFINAYDLIWNDAGSGANTDVSFWRPTPPQGWARVGHHVKAGHGHPTQPTMVVKAKPSSSHILKHPTDYSLIWNDSGSGANNDVSVWRPVCPSGYKALGDVVNGNHGKPALNEISCVKATALKKAMPGNYIWNDAGSGANSDFGAWGIESPSGENYSYESRGLFYSARSHARPNSHSVDVMWAIKSNIKKSKLLSDELHIDYSYVFEKTWDDAGSGADRDVGFFKPLPRDGYHALGHYIHPSHGQPETVVMVVKEKVPGALASPLNYQRIWNDAGSGANSDGAVWWPSCPNNYVALGVVTTAGHKPDNNAVKCVRSDLTVQAGVGEKIWDDSGSGANQDFSAWAVKPNDASDGVAYISPGTAIAHASHSEIGAQRARAIKLKLPYIPTNQKLEVPKLTSHARPSDFAKDTVTSEQYLPFTAVTDNTMSDIEKARRSPVYKLIRKDRYKLVNHAYNNTSDETQQTEWSYSIALTKAERFQEETGISLSRSWSASVAKGPFSASVETTITLSQSFTYESSRSETETTKITVPVEVPPKTSIAAYMVSSEFELYRADGTRVGPAGTINRPNSTVFVEFK